MNPLNPQDFFFRVKTKGSVEGVSKSFILDGDKLKRESSLEVYEALINYRHALSNPNSKVDAGKNKKLFISLTGMDPDEFYRIGQTTTEVI